MTDPNVVYTTVCMYVLAAITVGGPVKAELCSPADVFSSGESEK